MARLALGARLARWKRGRRAAMGVRLASRARLALQLTLTLLVSACGGGDAEPEAPDPLELLGQAADRMESVGSFAFLLEHENGTTTVGQGLQMVRADGRMVGTDRMQAQLLAMAGPVPLDVGVIVLPEGSWMTNPLTGAWMPDEVSVSQFFDPATGVPALMRRIPAATLAGIEPINGVDTRRVDATVTGDLLAGLVPDAAPGRSVQARFWIGEEDPVLHRLEIVGAVQAADPEILVRRLTFSEFGASFTISPPPS